MTIDERIANLEAQLKQTEANAYGIQGALSVCREIKEDEEAQAAAAAARPAPAQGVE